MTRIFLVLLACLLCFAGIEFCESNTPARDVRVAILKDKKVFSISVRGRYSMVNVKTGKLIGEGKRLMKTNVRIIDGRISVGEREFNTDHIRIKTKKDVTVYSDKSKKRYRGALDIKVKTGRFLVINKIDLESYVKGVLYHEVPHYWPMNTIKTQAVATRTYALYQTQQRVKEEFDVTSDIYSQVYGGRSAERHRSNIAANRTRGEILAYKGKVLPAYFSSTCGGKTENVAELWKHDLPPLSGKVCGFCNKSPHFRWKKNFRSKDVQDQLNLHGFELDLIKEIRVVSRNKSGRINKLKITTRKGIVKTISGIRFREIIGPNNLKSNHYDIKMQGYYFDVTGRGWGHGVGMCQWGALQMAKERYKYTSILEHYYPGAKIKNISEL